MATEQERERSGRRCGAWLLLAAALTATVLSACNTTEGVGEDLESAGEGISDAARDAKN